MKKRKINTRDNMKDKKIDKQKRQHEGEIMKDRKIKKERE